MKEERKRQARGLARMQSLLDAAEVAFARCGYSKATTNEIASEAGVSPATLYQFFSNKEELANALAQHYSHQISLLHDSVDLKEMAKLDIDDMVDELVDPMFQFHKKHPAFMCLMVDAPLSEETKEAKRAMSEKFVENTAKILRMRNEKLSSSQAKWKAETMMMLYKGFLNDVQHSEKDRKKRLIATFKHILELYLDSDSRDV